MRKKKLTNFKIAAIEFIIPSNTREDAGLPLGPLHHGITHRHPVGGPSYRHSGGRRSYAALAGGGGG